MDQERLRRMETDQLENRWASYLNDSLEPISMLDKEDTGYKRPTRYTTRMNNDIELFSRPGKSLYDRELQRMKDSRSSIKQFIDGQQKWLSKMRHDVTLMGRSDRRLAAFN